MRFVSLTAGLCFLIFFGCIPDAPQRPKSAVCVRDCDTLPGVEQKIFSMINDHRKAIGKAPFRWENRIADEARMHSAEVVSGQRPFGHEGFAARMAAVRQFLKAKSGAENIAQPHPLKVEESTLDLWLRSPGHKLNMEGDHTAAGLGIAKRDRTYIVTLLVVKE